MSVHISESEDEEEEEEPEGMPFFTFLLYILLLVNKMRYTDILFRLKASFVEVNHVHLVVSETFLSERDQGNAPMAHGFNFVYAA